MMGADEGEYLALESTWSYLAANFVKILNKKLILLFGMVLVLTYKTVCNEKISFQHFLVSPEK